MASAFSHAVAALGIGACFYERRVPKRVWLIGAACSVIPDLDVVGFRFGIRYGDFLGHRGFTHSLVFCRPSGECHRSHWISARSAWNGPSFYMVVLDRKSVV